MKYEKPWVPRVLYKFLDFQSYGSGDKEFYRAFTTYGHPGKDSQMEWTFLSLAWDALGKIWLKSTAPFTGWCLKSKFITMTSEYFSHKNAWGINFTRLLSSQRSTYDCYWNKLKSLSPKCFCKKISFNGLNYWYSVLKEKMLKGFYHFHHTSGWQPFWSGDGQLRDSERVKKLVLNLGNPLFLLQDNIPMQ